MYRYEPLTCRMYVDCERNDVLLCVGLPRSVHVFASIEAAKNTEAGFGFQPAKRHTAGAVGRRHPLSCNTCKSGRFRRFSTSTRHAVCTRTCHVARPDEVPSTCAGEWRAHPHAIGRALERMPPRGCHATVRARDSLAGHAGHANTRMRSARDPSMHGINEFLQSGSVGVLLSVHFYMRWSGT